MWRPLDKGVSNTVVALVSKSKPMPETVCSNPRKWKLRTTNHSQPGFLK